MRKGNVGRSERGIRSSSVRVVLGALAIAASASFAWSQEAGIQPDNEVHQSWSVICIKREGAPPCRMVQVVKQKEQVLMTFAIASDGGQDSYAIELQVPLGVLVSGGATIRSDNQGELRDLKFTRCMPRGCVIEGTADAKMLGPFREGKDAMVSILNARGQLVSLPVSLAGFSAAMDSATAKNRAWAKQ